MSDAGTIGRRLGVWTLLGVACAGGLALTGCNGPRPSRTHEFTVGDIENDPYYQSGYRLVWRAYPQIGRDAEPLFCEVLDGVLAFQDTANTFSLIEDGTGRVRWTASLGQRLEKFVGAAQLGDVVLAASESELQFLDEDNGQLVDRQRFAVLANTTPVILQPYAIVGSSTGEVYAHDLRVGVRVWGVMMDGPIESPVVKLGGNDVGCVSAGGEVIMLDAASGTSGGRRAKLFDGVENRAITDGAQFYVAGTDQSVWAYDIQSGRRAWRHRTESKLTAQPLVAEGVVVVYAQREGLLGIDARTGDRLWANTEVMGDAIASDGSTALIWDGTTLSSVSLRDGSVRTSAELPGIRWVLPGADNTLYAVTNDGVVSKYEPLS